MEKDEALAEPEKVTIVGGEVRLAADLYLPAGLGSGRAAGVVICHGLGSRKENHADFARLLQARGFVVLAFDLRGHGESDGQLDAGVAEDLPAAVEYLASRSEVDTSRLALRGSSLGGQLVIHAAASSDLVRATVAICPAHESMRLGEKTEAWLEALQQSAATLRLDPAGFSSYLREHDVTASVRKLSPRPLLLIHCRGDEVVPYRLSEKLFAAASEPRELWLLEGGSHGSAQHDPSLQLRVTDWLEAVLS